MKILNLVQGTPEWLEVRLSHFTASEAPAMMGASKYMSRTELLTLKKTGISKPVDEFTQKIFDKGHAAEESARVFAELEWFAELKPLVGAITVDDLPLLASFDGIDNEYTVVWEHKLFNKTLFENVSHGVLEACYYWQLEHQMLVAGIEKIMFTCSDGTEENSVSMIYTSQPERRKELIAGWKQFAKDLKAHEVVAKEEKIVAQELQALPKLEISLVGNVSNSNLVEYKTTALAFIQSVNTDLQSDQDFVDADKAVKFFTNGEKELEAVKERALSDTADIKTLFDTIDVLKEEMRQKRLTLSKLVKSRKEDIRNEISMKAKVEFSDLLIATSKNIKGIQITQVVADFDSVMKGKKTVESLQNAVDSEMARVKIELSEISELVKTNLNSFTELAADFNFLFNDYAHLAFKANDDLINLIKSRISEHKEDEKAKLEQQREKMRLEEERKAQAKVAEEEQRKAQIIENDRLLRERTAKQAEDEIEESPSLAEIIIAEEAVQEVVERQNEAVTLANQLTDSPVAERLAKRFSPSNASTGKAKMISQLKFWKDQYGVRDVEFNDLMNIINQHAYCEHQESNAA
jgi:putative phage-type endonuclease